MHYLREIVSSIFTGYKCKHHLLITLMLVECMYTDVYMQWKLLEFNFDVETAKRQYFIVLIVVSLDMGVFGASTVQL